MTRILHALTVFYTTQYWTTHNIVNIFIIGNNNTRTEADIPVYTMTMEVETRVIEVQTGYTIVRTVPRLLPLEYNVVC